MEVPDPITKRLPETELKQQPSKVPKVIQSSFNPIPNPGLFDNLPREIFSYILSFLILPSNLPTVHALERTCKAMQIYVWKIDFWQKKEIMALRIATLIRDVIPLLDLCITWSKKIGKWNRKQYGKQDEFICKHFIVEKQDKEYYVHPTPIDKVLASFESQKPTQQISSNNQQEKETLIIKVKDIIYQLPEYEKGINSRQLADALQQNFHCKWNDLTGIKLNQWLRLNVTARSV